MNGVAVVTGGGRGIGAAVVRALIAEGMTVWAAARNRAELAAVAKATGARAHPVDVTDPASVRALAEAAGAVDVLVNNAGVAHSAPLGLAFYTGQQFPPDYRGSLFVAYHGSWNRSVPTGYKVVRVPFADGRPSGPVEDFATGWLTQDRKVFGRPVDVLTAPDGALYLSDDNGGIVYRITYRRP